METDDVRKAAFDDSKTYTNERGNDRQHFYH